MFEVHTLIGDKWENTWNVEGIPVEFETYQEAVAAIEEHLSDTISAAEEGHLAEPYQRDQFHVYRLTPETRLKRALSLLLSVAELNQDALELDTLSKIEYAKEFLHGV